MFGHRQAELLPGDLLQEKRLRTAYWLRTTKKGGNGTSSLVSKHPGMFQTRDITYKGRSDQIKDLRKDVMIEGRNERRDVMIRDVLNSWGRSDQGRNNIAPNDIGWGIDKEPPDDAPGCLWNGTA
jgi:hypothetical protein